MKKEEIRKQLLHLFEIQGEMAKTSKEYYKVLLDHYRKIIGKFKTVFLFGGGVDGIMAYDFLSDLLQDKQVFFIDNDTEKHGKELYKGIYCYGREKMYGCNSETTIILITTTRYAGDVQKELLGDMPYSRLTQYQAADKLGMTHIDSGFIGCLYAYVNGNYYWLNREKLLRVFDWLDDDDSAELFYRILLNRWSGNTCMRGMMTLPQYFPREIKNRFTASEVFLDCGASRGDSVEDFRAQTNDVFEAIYSFEMDDEAYEQLLKSPQTQDDRVICIHAGVSDRNRRISYRKDICPTYFSGIALSGGEERQMGEAELKSIDSMVEEGAIKEKVTFVKMDIEGAEMDALRGMEKMMKRDKPKLAICVYHKLEDIWELPLYIKGIVPEYTLTMRHHHALAKEPVLYAYIK